MKAVHNFILVFLDNEDEEKQNLDDFYELLNFQQNQLDIQELKSILYLISKINKNHNRKPFFFDKIKKLILILKNEIKQSLSNNEIYTIFKKNKLILLYLIDEGILVFDSNISNKISRYKDYFIPEINKFNSSDTPVNIPEFYDEKRRKGENDNYVCELIRNDNIEEFVIYCAKNSNPFYMTIKPSIYETNSFLEDKEPKLIEYSAFYGSIQILRFLFQNQVELTQSLWIYAIHGRNPEIIHFLEENKILPFDQTYQECLRESIKCHHNDFALYFKNNFIDTFDDHPDYIQNELCYGFHYYNFEFIPIDHNNFKFFFFYSIEYNCFNNLVDYYYKNIKGLDINELII
ncbi:hypothetical protein M9Y10_012272 [Tritrichomonas musculus]|uniref:DUF3447 domain-containing protein n=1 Tax=Tritrichomonas musculus TaxID=1915356 RepID=A0ABR2IDT5_9EUKA